MSVGERGTRLATVAAAALGGALIGAGISFAIATSGRMAADERSGLERGHDLATLVCAQCHAVEADGVSPNPKSPPFRTMVDRLTEEGLQEQLEEGLPLGHAPMPPWNFSQEQEEDLLIYILSLAPENADG